MYMWWTCEIKKKEWVLAFKEIRKIIGCDIQISPIIALLNIIMSEHLKKDQKEFFVIMVTVAKLCTFTTEFVF